MAVLTGVLAGLVTGGWVAGSFLAGHVPALDISAAEWFAAHRSSGVTAAARLVTQLGGTAVLVPLAVVTGAMMATGRPYVGGRSRGALVGSASSSPRRVANQVGPNVGVVPGPTVDRGLGGSRFAPGRFVERTSLRVAAFLAVVFVGAEVMIRVVKPAVGRARPPADLAAGHFVDPAFPSAHVMLAVTMLGAVAAVVAGMDGLLAGPGRAALWRRAVWGTATAAMVAVALTRLYLGAHWLTDVIGGAVMAAAWLVAVTVVIRPNGPPGHRFGAGSAS